MAVSNNETVIIYTDGGCEPNPGLGGWGVVMQYKGTLKELSGCEAVTTNNRMELTAAVKALEALRRSCKIMLYTDSQYLQKGVTTWMVNWKRNNWRRKGGPVKNIDLWKKLDELIKDHKVEWHWVRGHSGNPMNERCDVLAREARKHLK